MHPVALGRWFATRLEHSLERQTCVKEQRLMITQWGIGPVLVGLGFWLAKLWEGGSAGTHDTLSVRLASYDPWALLAAGPMLFVILRLLIGWTVRNRLIRALLVLPPLDEVRRWRKDRD